MSRFAWPSFRSLSRPILVCLLPVLSCGNPLRSLQAPGTGLSGETPPGLTWELTVGVLNDQDFPPLKVERLRESLAGAARRLKEVLPGLNLKFIIDQPQNAAFIMPRQTRKRRVLENRQSPEHSVLLLGPGQVIQKINRSKLKHRSISESLQKSYLDELDKLQKTELRPGIFLLYDKFPVSDLNWREFLRQQVRYDLILTNAFIYPDDLQAPLEGRKPGFGVRSRLLRAEGRLGMEGFGAFLSLNPAGKISGGPGSQSESPGANLSAVIEEELVGVLLGLVLPGPVGTGPLERSPGIQALKNCSACLKLWEARREYLRGVYFFHQGTDARACALLRSNFRTGYVGGIEGKKGGELEHSPPRSSKGLSSGLSTDRGVWYFRPDVERARQIQKNHKLFLKVCPQRVLEK